MKPILLASMIFLTPTASFAAPSAPSPVPSTPFAFKGAALEEELSGWRSKAPPAQGATNLVPLCLGDEGAPRNDRRTVAQASAGVVQCGYTKREPYNYWSGGRIGDFEYTAADHFFLGGKLYRIEVMAVRDAEAEMVRLLSAKYGVPKIENSTGSNGLGSSIAVVRYQWSSKSATMTLTSPDLRVDRLTLVLSDTAGEAVVANVDQKRRPDADRI